MKIKSLLFAISLFVIVKSSLTAQVNVNGSTGANGSYANLRLAFDAINANGNQSNNTITIAITAMITDNSTAVLNQPTSNWNSLTVYPTDSVYAITGNVAGPLIKLNGTSQVTLNGFLDGSGSVAMLTIKNINTASGSSCVLFENDAKSNVVNYCKLYASNTNTGILDGAVIFSTTTGTDGNDDNSIMNSYIGSDIVTGNCIVSNGTPSKLNSGNKISNNRIYNFRGTGIYLAANSEDWTIMGNSFYNTFAEFILTATNRAIHVPSTANCSNLAVSGNYFGGQAVNCGGKPMTFTGSKGFMYAPILSVCNAGTVTMNANVFKNIAFTESGIYDTGIFCMDLSGSSHYKIGEKNAGNIFGDTTGTASISYAWKKTTDAGEFRGIVLSGTGEKTVTYNRFGSIKHTSPYGLISFVKITNPGKAVVQYNTFGSSTPNSINVHAQVYFRAIEISFAGACTIKNNVIQNILMEDRNYKTSFYGILANSPTGTTIDCQYNSIKNISYFTQFFNPISLNLAAGPVNIVSHNNIGGTGNDSILISDITTSTASLIYLNVPTATTAGSLNLKCVGNEIRRIIGNSTIYGIYYRVDSAGITNTNVVIDSNSIHTISCKTFSAIKTFCRSGINSVSCSYNTISNTFMKGLAIKYVYGFDFGYQTTNANAYTVNQNVIEQLNTEQLWCVYSSENFIGTNNTFTKINAREFRGIYYIGSKAVIDNNKILTVKLDSLYTTYFIGIQVQASDQATITGNVINAIDCYSSVLSGRFDGISAGGQGVVTIGTMASPNIIGSVNGAWSPTDGINLNNPFTLITLSDYSQPGRVAYNRIGGINVHKSASGYNFRMIENYSSVDAFIEHNVIGNSAPNNMSIAGNIDLSIIDNVSGNKTNTMTVTDNIIQNFKIINTGGLSRTISCVDNTSHGGLGENGSLLCRNNTFTNLDVDATPAKINLISTGSYGGGSQKISKNSFSNIIINAAQSINFIAMTSFSTQTETCIVDSNMIGNSTPNNIIIRKCYGSGIIYSSKIANGSFRAQGNKIQNFYIEKENGYASFSGIYNYHSDNSGSKSLISNNQISEISCNGCNIVRGICISTDNFPNRNREDMISENYIHHLTMMNAQGGNNELKGIDVNAQDSVLIIQGNHIYSLINLAKEYTNIYGIVGETYAWQLPSARNLTVFNNSIILDNGGNSNPVSIKAIHWASTRIAPRFYHNTLKVSGRSSGAVSSSALSLGATVVSTSVYNNIFQNTRAGGSGFNYAFNEASDAGSSVSWDYNYVEVAENSSKCISLKRNNVTTDYSFPNWLAFQKSSHDLSGLISLDPLGAVSQPTTADIKSNGINSTGITQDIDKNIRANGAVTIPCGTCNGPWRGAYETSIPIVDSTYRAIATGVIRPNRFCSGYSLTIPYSISGTFGPGNVFTAQLSDANGNFTTATILDSLKTTTAGIIHATISSAIVSGNKYRIRIISSVPFLIGTDNGVDLGVNNTVISNPQVICSGNSYSVNGHVYTVTGSYRDTLVSFSGCDSIVATQLTVNSVKINSNPQIICEGSSYMINGHSYTVANTYTDTLKTYLGCDSIVITQLAVKPSPTVSVTINGDTLLCHGGSVVLTASTADNYLWNNNASSQSIIVTSTGTYFVKVTAANGCSVTSKLVKIIVNPSPNKPTITANGLTLTSSATSGNQWYFDKTIIPGAIAQQYTVLQNGNYSVTVKNSYNCSASSDPYNVLAVNISKDELEHSLAIFPNPGNGQFTIQGLLPSAEVNIKNTLGEIMFSAKVTTNKMEFDLSKESKGIYFIHIHSQQQLITRKIIIQ